MPTFWVKGSTTSVASQSFMADPTGFFSVHTVPNFRADNLGTRTARLQYMNPWIAGAGGSRSCQVYCGRPSGSSDAGFAYSSSFTVPSASKATLQGNKSVTRKLLANTAYHFGVTQPGGALYIGRGNEAGPIRRRDGEAQVWSESMVIQVTYAEVPLAPDTSLGVDQATATSLRFRFQSSGDGGSAITGWKVQYSKSSDFSSDVTTIDSSGTSVVTGLDPDTTYYFRAAGRNAVSDANGAGHYGPWGTTRSGTTLSGAPSAPASTTLTELSPTTMKLDWTAPASDGGSPITGYDVEYSQNADFSSSTIDSLGVVLTWTSPSLGAGDWYFRVRAKNANGDGAWGEVKTNSVVQTGFVKTLLGGTPVAKPVKVYLGGTFVQKPMKRYSGGVWVTLT